MPRKRNEKPTYIYWLVDVRPEVLAAGWPNGQPFYCGKTVRRLEQRFWAHKSEFLRSPKRALSVRFAACQKYVIIKLMEIVPPEIDWISRERHWIKLLRASFGGVNVSDGGDGIPGAILGSPSKETLEKLRTSHLGKTPSIETRAKMSEAQKRIMNSEERKESARQMGYARKGAKHSEESREKIKEARKLQIITSEHRAKMIKGIREAYARKGPIKLSPERIEQMRLRALGKKASAETREKMRISQQKRRTDEWTRRVDSMQPPP